MSNSELSNVHVLATLLATTEVKTDPPQSTFTRQNSQAYSQYVSQLFFVFQQQRPADLDKDSPRDFLLEIGEPILANTMSDARLKVQTFTDGASMLEAAIEVVKNEKAKASEASQS